MMQIQEVINKCLFFLAAGFSRPAGCKASSEMLDDLRYRIQDHADNIFNKIEKQSLSFLLSCLSYHCEWRSIQSGGKFKFSSNIEDLILLMRRIRGREDYLPYPVTGSWADKLVQLETDFNSWAMKNGYEINELFSSIESKIKKTLLREWLQFDNNKLGYLKPLSQFFQDFAGQTFCIDICTINNDKVVEAYFCETGIWMGFSNGKWVGVDSEPELEEERRRINLYKLHGSLDWFSDIAGDIFEKEMQQGQEEEENEQIDQDPCIIFGQGTKTFSIEPYFSLIYHFRRLLQNKEYFFIIGYSFFDPYINNLLISAIRGTNKKIIIINPKFGPEELRNGKDKKNQFKECQYPGYKQILSEYICEIQKNSFYSELPEFNVKSLNPDSLFYSPLGAETFITEYFENRGGLLKKLIEKFDSEKIKVEQPFE